MCAAVRLDSENYAAFRRKGGNPGQRCTAEPEQRQEPIGGAGESAGLRSEMVRVSLDCGFSLKALVTNQACQELVLREGEHVIALLKAPAIHLVPRD